MNGGKLGKKQTTEEKINGWKWKEEEEKNGMA
jgi:hypothetical protein